MSRRVALIVLLVLAVASLASAQTPSFERPGLLTSMGQSSDIAIVKVMLNTQLKLGLDYRPLAQPAEVAGMKTVVIVVGVSTKGLGAAGLDLAKEMERATAVVKAAKAAGARILVMHTGGEARRGKTSNDVISLVVPDADYVVVVAGGNKDKLFNTLAAKRNVPVVEVEKMADAGAAVKTLFK
jgi:hypothetical protein